MELAPNMIVGFNVDGLYIKLHGPFPQGVIDAVNNHVDFSDRATLLRWLNVTWSDWQKHVVVIEDK